MLVLRNSNVIHPDYSVIPQVPPFPSLIEENGLSIIKVTVQDLDGTWAPEHHMFGAPHFPESSFTNFSLKSVWVPLDGRLSQSFRFGIRDYRGPDSQT